MAPTVYFLLFYTYLLQFYINMFILLNAISQASQKMFFYLEETQIQIQFVH
jgi:hypothetical protein